LKEQSNLQAYDIGIYIKDSKQSLKKLKKIIELRKIQENSFNLDSKNSKKLKHSPLNSLFSENVLQSDRF
jgi:hypothetical protein